jgi:outer membrane protein OmpA-like peptidoglycan-associated protein
MPNARSCLPSVVLSRRDWHAYTLCALASATSACLALAACTQAPTQPSASVQASSPSPAQPVQVLPFDAAVLAAANTVFSSVPATTDRKTVLIDPLVDGVTGEQTNATRSIRDRIVALAAEKYPQFTIAPFTPEAVNAAPLVMVGTFTPVNAQGQTAGDKEAFRFCLVMADLQSGKAIAKGVTRARMENVDATPIPFFSDSPAWTADPRIKSYINTCQATKVGDPIDPLYLNGILTASIISEAIDAYDAGRYREALDLYASAQQTQAGDQLRVYNGLYLTNWKLGRTEAATDAFGRAVNYGLAANRLGVKILFRPGSTALMSEPSGSPYDMWLRQIAGQSAQKGSCLEVTGNTSKTGSPALNERLSLLRAEYVKSQLEEFAPPLNGRVIAAGVGARANLIGTGTDDRTDALDRRVEFKVLPNC